LTDVMDLRLDPRYADVIDPARERDGLHHHVSM
jgi:hypothetical protein